MKSFFFIFLMSCLGSSLAKAQNDYVVTTAPQKVSNLNEEEKFIEQYFPLQIVCNWKPGMKFMFIPDSKDLFIPIFCQYETGKDLDNSKYKYKIFEFQGTEEKVTEISANTNYSTRFIFTSENEKFYHEIKNLRLEEICQKNPRTSINGLVYLKDVDTARKHLIGKIVYNLGTMAKIDDPNSYLGYKEVAIKQNQKLTITNIGVGTKITPVKIIFEDINGNSYFMEEAFSRTNSGMDIRDFQADKKMKYFPNAFSFTDRNANSKEALKNKYVNMAGYPKKTLPVKGSLELEGQHGETRVNLLRYTPVIIKDIILIPSSTAATLILADKNGKLYQVDVDLKYDFITKNENFIDDLFAFEDIRKKHPHISEENWKLIALGEIKTGMTTDECRLALGDPIQIEIKKDTRFETWFYNGRVLEFENANLLRFK